MTSRISEDALVTSQDRILSIQGPTTSGCIVSYRL